MTSLFRMLSKNFDPPPTVESVGVTPASEHVAVSDAHIVERDFAQLAELTKRRRRTPAG